MLSNLLMSGRICRGIDGTHPEGHLAFSGGDPTAISKTVGAHNYTGKASDGRADVLLDAPLVAGGTPPLLGDMIFEKEVTMRPDLARTQFDGPKQKCRATVDHQCRDDP